MAWKSKEPRPPVRFCWECGRQLMANSHTVVEVQQPGGPVKVVMHKSCATEMTNGGTRG